MPLSRDLGSLTPWNPLGVSRPVMRLLYLLTTFVYDARVEMWLHELNGDDWPASSSDNFNSVTVGGEAGWGPGAGLYDVE